MGPTQPADFAATIEQQRQQLFKASAVADMCRYACTSLSDDFTPDQLSDALQVVSNLIDDVTGALEQFDSVQEPVDDIDPELVVESLRNDAALLLRQHPQLHAIHAQFLRAATVIETLVRAADD